jgi:PqqD family protein of HPr-rel-A system
MNRRWRKCNDADFVYANFEDAHIAYHRPSGTTHLLNETSYQLITEYLSEPADLISIAEVFADKDNSEAFQEHLEHTATMVYRLEQIGFLELA